MRINKDDTASHVAAFDNDPVLNQVQMSLGLAGGDVGAYVLQAGNGSGSQGAALMNQLVGLAMQRTTQGGVRHQGSQGSSAGPAIGAGVGGLALGAAGGALLSQLGKKKNAAAVPATTVAPVTLPVNNASGSPATVQTAPQTPPPMPRPTPPPAVKTANTSVKANPPIDVSKVLGYAIGMGSPKFSVVPNSTTPATTAVTPPPKCDPNLASCPDPLASNLFSSTSNGTK